jgi:SAM-dependent methyltransferase
MPAPAYELSPCPVCGWTRDEQLATQEELRAEVEMLWAFHGRRLRGGTPPERLVDRVAFSQHAPLRVGRCPRCGLVYRNPRERERVLTDVYAGETPDPAVLDALFVTQRAAYEAQARRLAEVAGASGVGIEVGSYVGGFLAAAADRGWRFTGLDVNAATNAATRRRGFAVVDGDLASLSGDDGPVDVVAIWNCLDQLPDPRLAVRHARRLVRDGGVFAARVPNGAAYASWRARLHGPAAPLARLVLAHNNLLAFPYRHGFTVPSLEWLLRHAGFRVERVHGDALVPIADEWTRAWAALEERAVKAALRVLARGEPRDAPWVEVYARAA